MRNHGLSYFNINSQKGEKSMRNYILKISYWFSWKLSVLRAWILLQELHVMYLMDKSEEARTMYETARYKFHHL